MASYKVASIVISERVESKDVVVKCFVPQAVHEVSYGKFPGGWTGETNSDCQSD